MLHLKAINDRGQLGQDLVSLLVVLELCSNQVRKVSQRFRGVQHLGWSVCGEDTHMDMAENLTFFITLTASSVWPTNSSSACSISARASSLRLSRSPRAAAFLRALIESSDRRAFSTLRRALVANVRLVLSVVFHPARKRDWICASCASRASPTFSSASAYFSSAVARGSSRSGVVCAISWDPASAARAIAWLKVLGCGFADGGAVSAACASAGEVAWDSSWTFSLMVRPRSLKDSRMLGG